MRPRTAERMLSRALDGELSPRQAARLARYLEREPGLRETERFWKATGAALREAAVPPARLTAEAAWQETRRALREAAEGSAEGRPAWTFGSPLRWAAATVAVVLVAASAVWVLRTVAPAGGPALASHAPPEVEWVETDLPDAVSMVYQDAETGWTVIWVMADEPQEKDEQAGS